MRKCFLTKLHFCRLQHYYQVNSYIEAVVRKCFVKKVFLKISQNPQKSTSARVSLLINPVNFAKFLRTPFLENTYGSYFCHLQDSQYLINSIGTRTNGVHYQTYVREFPQKQLRVNMLLNIFAKRAIAKCLTGP